MSPLLRFLPAATCLAVIGFALVTRSLETRPAAAAADDSAAPALVAIEQLAPTDLNHPASVWWPDLEVLCEDDLDTAWQKVPKHARHAIPVGWLKALRDYPLLQRLPANERAALRRLRAQGVFPRVKLALAIDGATRVVAIDLSGETDSTRNDRRVTWQREILPKEFDSPASDAALAVVHQFPALQAVFLCGTQVTDAGLETLSALKDLRYVWLPPHASDDGLRRLAHISSLQYLSLYGCRNITGEGFTAWKTHPGLVSVKAAFPTSQESLLTHLKNAPALQSVFWHEAGNLLRERLPVRPDFPAPRPDWAYPLFGVTPDVKPTREPILPEDLDEVFALWERHQEAFLRREGSRPSPVTEPRELRDFFALQSVPSDELDALRNLRKLNIWPRVQVGRGSDGQPHIISIDLAGRMTSIAGPGLTKHSIGDDAMDSIARLPELQIAILCETGITDAGVVRLLELKHLHYAWLPPRTTDEGMDHLAEHPTIEQLNLHGCANVTSDGFSRWRGHPTFATLHSALSDLRRALPILETMPRFRGPMRGLPPGRSIWRDDLAWLPDIDVLVADELGQIGQRVDAFERQTARTNHRLRQALEDFVRLQSLPPEERAALAALRSLGYRPRVRLAQDASGAVHVVAIDPDGGSALFGATFEFRDNHFWRKQVGDEAIDAVVRLSHLQALFLHETAVTDAAVPALLRLRDLRYLRLQTHLTETGLAALAALPSIEHLEGPASIAAWRNHPRLQSVNLLGISAHYFPADALRMLSTRPDVRVAIDGSRDRAAALTPLLRWWPETVALSDADIEAFQSGRTPTIPPGVNPRAYLRLDHAENHYAALQNLPADERAALAAMRQLEAWPHVKVEPDETGTPRVIALRFGSSAYPQTTHIYVSDAVMPFVARFTKLEALLLDGTLVSEANVIATVRGLPALRYLWSPSKLSDKGLAALATHPGIEHLNLLPGAKISIEGFAAWRNHPRLTSILLPFSFQEPGRVVELLRDAPRIHTIFTDRNLLEPSQDESPPR